MTVVLTPGERAALDRLRARDQRRVIVLAIVCAVMGLLPITIFLGTQPQRVFHLLGQSREVRAEVIDAKDRGACGRRNRNTQWRVTVRYTLDGQRTTAAYDRCAPRPPRTAVTVWVGPTGWIEDSSPTWDRVGSLGAGALPAGVLALLVARPMLVEQRRRRALLDLESGGAEPIGRVALWPDPSGRGEVTVSWPGREPSPYEATIDPVVITGADGTPVALTTLHWVGRRDVEVFAGSGRGVLTLMDLEGNRVWAWVEPGRRSRRDVGSRLRR